MKKVVSLLVLTLLVFCFMSPVKAAVVFYDYFDRIDGDPGSDWDVISGAWAIEGGELSGDNDDANTANLKIMTTTSFSGYSHVVLEAKVVFKGWYECQYGAEYLRIGIIIQKNPASLFHDWCLVIRGDNRLCLLSEGVTWGPNIAFTPAVDTAYRMKMMYDGTDIKGKCWIDGETEPDWQLSVQWTDTVSDARIGLYAASAHAHFDDVIVHNPDNFHVIPEPAPVMISVLFVAALAAYSLIRKRTSNKTIIKP